MTNSALQRSTLMTSYGGWGREIDQYQSQIRLLEVVLLPLTNSLQKERFVKELLFLRNELGFQKNVLNLLYEELKRLIKSQIISHAKSDKISDLMNVVQLGGRIKEAEKNIVLLKIQVNNFLSLASS